MANTDYTIVRGADRAVATNKVLKNTYMLLSATLVFSALMAGVSMMLAVPSWTYLASVIVAMVLGIFVLPETANSTRGIGMIFLITGLLGFGLGAILTMYLALPNGPQIIGTAFAGTGLPWITWAIGDYGVKLAMAFGLLIPFRALMPKVRSIEQAEA